MPESPPPTTSGAASGGPLTLAPGRRPPRASTPLARTTATASAKGPPPPLPPPAWNCVPTTPPAWTREPSERRGCPAKKTSSGTVVNLTRRTPRGRPTTLGMRPPYRYPCLPRPARRTRTSWPRARTDVPAAGPPLRRADASIVFRPRRGTTSGRRSTGSATPSSARIPTQRVGWNS
jgi:hypothetical protein